jgi:dTMP kinase
MASHLRGRFLVLDGLDGCGKSTQAARLVARLAESAGGGGPAPLHLREPGSTAAGERIRALLLDPEPALAPAAQALLFAAARRQMLEELVEPALALGRDVVCERFHPSTFAYQGVALDVGPERVLALLHEWAGTPAPDLTVVLDIDAETARGRRGNGDRFESRDERFHARVAEGYRRYAALAAPIARVAVVDARGTADEVAARIWTEVARGRG